MGTGLMVGFDVFYGDERFHWPYFGFSEPCKVIGETVA
jgi:hypothetical protein